MTEKSIYNNQKVYFNALNCSAISAVLSVLVNKATRAIQLSDDLAIQAVYVTKKTKLKLITEFGDRHLYFDTNNFTP